MLALAAFAAFGGLSADSALAETTVFKNMGCETWEVPAGVTSVQAQATGAAGSGASAVAGHGDGVTATLSDLTPGESLRVCVDYGGGPFVLGSYIYGEPGGGASGVSIGATFEDPVLVAGGGGGGVGIEGLSGYPGGSAGEPGMSPSPGGGGGGGGATSSAPGAGGAGGGEGGGVVGHKGEEGKRFTASGPGEGGAGGYATGPPGVDEIPFASGSGGGGYYGGGGGGTTVESFGNPGEETYSYVPASGGGGSDYCENTSTVSGCVTVHGAGSQFAAGEAPGDANVFLTYTAVTGASGPTGATGPSGPAGATGPQGVTGATGAQGPTGASGATGATGNTGGSGATGATGPQGVTGATGAQGATGSSGSNGASGAAGATGATGPTGATGATGQAGASGKNGATGASGPTGPSGARGATGATGATGKEGAKGATGASGSAGSTGATGPAGNAAIATFASSQSVPSGYCLNYPELAGQGNGFCPAKTSGYSPSNLLAGPAPASGETVTNLYADTNITLSGTETATVAVIDNTTGAMLLSCTVTAGKSSCSNAKESGTAAPGENIEVKVTDPGSRCNDRASWRVRFRY